MEPHQQDSFVRLPEAQRIAGGVHRHTLYKWSREGEFPPYYKLSTRIFVWRRSELDRWIEEQKAEVQPEPQP